MQEPLLRRRFRTAVQRRPAAHASSRNAGLAFARKLSTSVGKADSALEWMTTGANTSASAASHASGSPSPSTSTELSSHALGHGAATGDETRGAAARAGWQAEATTESASVRSSQAARSSGSRRMRGSIAVSAGQSKRYVRPSFM